MSTYGNQILLTEMGGFHEEYPAAAALKPGHLIELTSATKVQKHSTSGGAAQKMFAKEDALQGKTIDDAYAADDVVFGYIAQPGDRLQARVAANAAAITEGDWLASAGDGTLKKVEPIKEELYASIADSSAHSNTTTEADLSESYTIAANTLRVGDVLEIDAQALVTAANSTDTLTLLLNLGAVTLATTGAVDVAANDIGTFKAKVTVRAIGASGSITASGTQSLGVPGTVTSKPFTKTNALDTTVANKIAVNADWSVANAGNSVKLTQLIVTIQRGGSAAGAGGSPVGGVLAQALVDLDNSAVAEESFIKIRVL